MVLTVQFTGLAWRVQHQDVCLCRADFMNIRSDTVNDLQWQDIVVGTRFPTVGSEMVPCFREDGEGLGVGVGLWGSLEDSGFNAGGN